MDNEERLAFTIGMIAGFALCLFSLIILAKLTTSDLTKATIAIEDRIEAECVEHEYVGIDKKDGKFIITFECR